MTASLFKSCRNAAIAVLSVVAALGCAATAHAKDHGTLHAKMSATRSGTLVLKWNGTVAAPMTEQIQRAFERHRSEAKRVVLMLDSGGGSVQEGEKTIALLRRIRKTHRLETVVNHGRMCGSMCVFIYMQGQKRVAALTSSWLFHEVSRSRGDRVVALDRSRWIKLVDDYFAPEGVSAQWISNMKALTHRTDLWQTGADLINENSGIVHEALGNQKGRVVHDGKPPGPPAERTKIKDVPISQVTPPSRTPDDDPEEGGTAAPAEVAEPSSAQKPKPANTFCKISLPGFATVEMPCAAVSMR